MKQVEEPIEMERTRAKMVVKEISAKRNPGRVAGAVSTARDVPAKSADRQVPGKMVGALQSGLLVLIHLSKADRPMGVSEIARNLSINTSTCFNLLKTLVHEGLADFDPTEKNYTISHGMVELVGSILDKDGMPALSKPYLQAIAKNRSVSATLWRFIPPDRMVLVELVPNGERISLHMSIGQRLPAYLAAFGRCMAAHRQLSTDSLKAEFDELRWQSAPSFDTYRREVEQAKVDGYAIDRDNFVRGITTISALILKDGEPVGAISAVGLSGQFTTDDLNALASDLRGAVVEIGARISRKT